MAEERKPPRPASRSSRAQQRGGQPGPLPPRCDHTVDTGNVKAFFVYITASSPRGVLYVGVTSDLPGRTWEHREHQCDGFTKRYWANRLVYYEFHESASTALPRERALKRWRRSWKIELVEKDNPTWADLYRQALVEHGFTP